MEVFCPITKSLFTGNSKNYKKGNGYLRWREVTWCQGMIGWTTKKTMRTDNNDDDDDGGGGDGGGCDGDGDGDGDADDDELITIKKW